MEVAAVYFPSYHRDAWYDRWYGDGWSEWDLVNAAQPLFPGHEQPKRCTWGAFDEADPRWMARQIDLAADHGITCFLFDWYWYEGRQFLQGALERGFLHAPNRERLRFFVMWANHTWGVFPACRERFRGPTGRERRNEGQALAYDRPLLEIRHSLADLEAVGRYCAAHYWREPNHLRIDGKPVFGIWRWAELETSLGSPAAVAEGLERLRAVARAAGFPGLHITVNVANYENEETVHCWWPALIERVKAAGADAVFGYNVARTDGYGALTDDRPLVPYEDVIASHRALFARCEGRGLPFSPVATVGFDNTPRWHRDAALPLDFRRLHYEPIVIDNTPARFGEVVDEALGSLRRQGGDGMVLLNAWNEWTEGCQLLPTECHGLGYLEVLRDRLRAAGRP